MSVKVLPQLAKLTEKALELIFPQQCVGCGKDGSLICYSCQRTMRAILPPICPRCGRPQSSGQLCPSCVAWPAKIDGIRAPFRFEGVIREAIHALKYKNVRILAAPLAELLYCYLTKNPVSGDVLVPVPLHKKRLRERGYNQSCLLAKELGKLTNLTVADSCLIRQHHTSAQARAASVAERRSNVADAFSYNHELGERRVLLIDDVSTSGATLNACAIALKAGGIPSVWGLVLAREI